VTIDPSNLLASSICISLQPSIPESDMIGYNPLRKLWNVLSESKFPLAAALQNASSVGAKKETVWDRTLEISTNSSLNSLY